MKSTLHTAQQHGLTEVLGMGPQLSWDPKARRSYVAAYPNQKKRGEKEGESGGKKTML